MNNLFVMTLSLVPDAKLNTHVFCLTRLGLVVILNLFLINFYSMHRPIVSPVVIFNCLWYMSDPKYAGPWSLLGLPLYLLNSHCVV